MKNLILLLTCLAVLLSCNNQKKQENAEQSTTDTQIVSKESTIATSHDFEVNGIYYKINSRSEKTVKVTHKGSSWDNYDQEYAGAVEIPSSVSYKDTTYTVMEIDDSAFRGCSTMNSITVPESIWIIGRGTFEGCDGLKKIHINDLSSWCELSFWDVLDDSGESPFNYAEELYLNGELVTDLVVPEGVTKIGAHAFEGYEKLMSVVLPKGIEAIFKSAFRGCSNLKSINFPDSLYYIGPYAFDDTAWYENKPDGEVYAGKHFYKYKGEMPPNTSITIKEGTETICESAFENCKGLTRITLPSSIRCIHNYAFADCTNLKEIYCKASTPPHLNNFYNDYHKDAVLYVPKGTLETYKNDDLMGSFKNMVEIEF